MSQKIESLHFASDLDRARSKTHESNAWLHALPLGMHVEDSLVETKEEIICCRSHLYDLEGDLYPCE